MYLNAPPQTTSAAGSAPAAALRVGRLGGSWLLVYQVGWVDVERCEQPGVLFDVDDGGQGAFDPVGSGVEVALAQDRDDGALLDFHQGLSAWGRRAASCW
jgi:hypothetical protein